MSASVVSSDTNSVNNRLNSHWKSEKRKKWHNIRHDVTTTKKKKKKGKRHTKGINFKLFNKFVQTKVKGVAY